MCPRKRRPVGDILVVDDQAANLEILTTMLKECGHQVRPVNDGRLAIEAARRQPPDLILLDINMPSMDGYQVCAVLKADPRLAKIPVIFVSANTDIFDKVTAFSFGGVDYVTKPFQFEEVEARVETHLELHQKRKELEKNYAALAELESLRDSLVHMMVHDLRSPLTALVASLDFLKSGADSLNEEQRDDIEEALKAAKRMVLMVTGVLDVNKLEAGKMTLNPSSCDAKELAREVMDGLSGLVEGREFSLVSPKEGTPAVLDRGLIYRVLQNLLANALKFTPSPGGRVEVKAETIPEGVRFEVKDNGPGIPAEHQAAIFEKFGRVDGSLDTGVYSTGLGLSFCKLAVEAHGGQIGVESQVGKGSTFWFTLPQKATS